jgi:hypothetical protein
VASKESFKFYRRDASVRSDSSDNDDDDIDTDGSETSGSESETGTSEDDDDDDDEEDEEEEEDRRWVGREGGRCLDGELVRFFCALCPLGGYSLPSLLGVSACGAI